MVILQHLQALRKTGKKGFSLLLDPDKADEFSHLHEFSSAAFLMLGGSLLVSQTPDAAIEQIRRHSRLPLVLFPGNAFQISDRADAILFITLISGRNADLLIGQHVVAAPFVRASGMEVIPTGYMLVDSGRMTTAHYMSGTLPLPADKPEIAASTALAGQLLGLKALYLDAGSGAERPVSPAVIAAVRAATDIPLIVGGGLRDADAIRTALYAGADLVVIGTAIESGDNGLSSSGINQIFSEFSSDVHH